MKREDEYVYKLGDATLTRYKYNCPSKLIVIRLKSLREMIWFSHNINNNVQSYQSNIHSLT